MAPASAGPGATAPRPNPFAFPSDVDFRLLLLVTAVVASGLFAYNWIYFGLPVASGDLPIYQRCAQAAAAAHPNDPVGWEQVFEQCRAPVERRKADWMVGGAAAMVLLALGLYILAPTIKLRRQRLIPLTADDAPEVVAALAMLSKAAGLTRPPQFVWNPLNGSAVGLAFGRRGRYYVALTGGLVTRFYTDRAAFEAVVLHELGHIRNGDVDKAYLAISLWQSFVIVGLLPLGASIVIGHDMGSILNDVWILGWRVAALAGFVYLLRNAVLRSRETYADLRAATWGGSIDPLTRALGSVGDHRRIGFERWRNALEVHPSRESRRQALTDTRPLFRIGRWSALGAGLAAGISYPTLLSLGLMAFTGVWLDVWSWTTGEVAGMLASTLLGLLIAGVVGVALWRATFIAIVDHDRSMSILALSAAVAAGVGLGAWIAFDGGFQRLPEDPVDVAVYVVVYVAVLAVLAGGMFLILQWFVGNANKSLRQDLGRSSAPRWVVSFALLAVVLAIWLGVMMQSRDELQAAAASSAPPWSYPVLAAAPLLQALWNPVGLLALGCVTVFPLVVAAGRIGVDRVPTWAFLDAPPPLTLRLPARLQMRRVFLTAAIGAAVYGVLYGGFRIGLGSTRRFDDAHILLIFGLEVGLTAVIAGCVAAVTAARSAGAPLAQGFAAAVISGVLMVVEASLIDFEAGGKGDPTGWWASLTVTLFAGSALAFPAAWLAGLATANLRRT